MAAYGRQAVFLGAGGYHHHLGANSWQSAGAPPARRAPPGSSASPSSPPTCEPAELTDPSGNRLMLVPAG